MPKVLKFLGSILLCEGAGILGAFFTTSNIATWYITLNKPIFNPPNWIFGPVWTLLYLLMGISLYLIWQAKVKNKGKAYQFFFVQLGLNTLWSAVFFGAHSLFLSLIIIVALWIFIYLTIKTFVKINKWASYLLYPYLAWVFFATILNLAIVILNP